VKSEIVVYSETAEVGLMIVVTSRLHQQRAKEGHNLGHSFLAPSHKLLKIQTTLVDSQSSNTGSIPVSATISPLSGLFPTRSIKSILLGSRVGSLFRQGKGVCPPRPSIDF
jgi:hypothetical protein